MTKMIVIIKEKSPYIGKYADDIAVRQQVQVRPLGRPITEAIQTGDSIEIGTTSMFLSLLAVANAINGRG